LNCRSNTFGESSPKSGEDVRVTLHDGETLTIASGDVDRVFENLWSLSPKPGAVTLAGVLVAQSRPKTGLRLVDLTEPQSA
jgi:hypothetical protein